MQRAVQSAGNGPAADPRGGMVREIRPASRGSRRTYPGFARARLASATTIIPSMPAGRLRQPRRNSHAGRRDCPAARKPSRSRPRKGRRQCRAGSIPAREAWPRLVRPSRSGLVRPGIQAVATHFSLRDRKPTPAAAGPVVAGHSADGMVAPYTGSDRAEAWLPRSRQPGGCRPADESLAGQAVHAGHGASPRSFSASFSACSARNTRDLIVSAAIPSTAAASATDRPW